MNQGERGPWVLIQAANFFVRRCRSLFVRCCCCSRTGAVRGLLRIGSESAQAALAADLALLYARHALDLREGAHEISAEDFQNVLLAVAASQKLVGDVRQIF